MILPTKSLTISHNHHLLCYSEKLLRPVFPFLFQGIPMNSMFVGVMLRGYQVGRSSEVYHEVRG